MTNRITHHLNGPCRCCRVRRKLRRMAAECNAVERLMGAVAEFMVPSVEAWLSGERRQPRLFLSAEFVPAKPGADLREYAAVELRRVALEMLAAADRLAEGGAA